MDILSKEHLARNGSEKNNKKLSGFNSSGTNSKPVKSNKRKTKYTKLYELPQTTAPGRNAKEPPMAELEKLTAKTPFQKSIASDIDMKKELENRDKLSKDHKEKMLKKSSSIVETFLKESIKDKKTAPIDKPKVLEQPSTKLRKSTAKTSFQKSIASDIDMNKELENRDKMSKDHEETMLKKSWSIVDTFLKESNKDKKTDSVDKPKVSDQPVAKLKKSTAKSSFQKSIASDLDMRKELENRDQMSKDHRKKMLTICSSIVDALLNESINDKKTAPLDKPKILEQPATKHGKPSVTDRFQKNIASDLDMKKELDNRDVTEKDYRKRMLIICSNIVDTFLKESVKGKPSAAVDKPRKQSIFELDKSNGKTPFRNSIASDHDMAQEFENRDQLSEDYGKRMLNLCSSVVDRLLKEFDKPEKSSKRKTKYTKLYELPQTTAPGRNAKVPPMAKLEKLAAKTPFQKSFASDFHPSLPTISREHSMKQYATSTTS